MSLIATSNAIWSEVRRKIGDAMLPGAALTGIEEFIPRRRLRSVHQGNPALFVISRTIRVVEWGANRGLGEIAITFGVTQTTLRLGDVTLEIEELLFALVGIFIESPSLGGADDVRVEEINPEDDPFGAEDTLPWATATLVWLFQFVQPEGAH